MIATTRATHGIIVTITNYCFYQDIKNYGSNGVSNNESNNGNDTDGMREQRQPDNINKNDKNDNNIPPIIPQGDEHTKLFEKTSNPYRCASFLDNAISERLPERKRAIEQQLQKWADAFDKAKRIDGYSWELIGYLLEKSQEDDFWQKNILSGATFRKQIEKLYAKFGDEK
ncbi:MAG: hypothetical protein Q8873_00395 [Bacillota bacterium]|nr:hypothetical protein [Bacillota bacterium]